MTRRESQVLVNYPPCDGYFELEEDVTLGCHQGALFATRPTKHPIHLASNLSYRRILDFLAQVGTQCDTVTNSSSHTQAKPEPSLWAHAHTHARTHTRTRGEPHARAPFLRVVAGVAFWRRKTLRRTDTSRSSPTPRTVCRFAKTRSPPPPPPRTVRRARSTHAFQFLYVSERAFVFFFLSHSFKRKRERSRVRSTRLGLFFGQRRRCGKKHVPGLARSTTARAKIARSSGVGRRST